MRTLFEIVSDYVYSHEFQQEIVKKAWNFGRKQCICRDLDANEISRRLDVNWKLYGRDSNFDCSHCEEITANLWDILEHDCFRIVCNFFRPYQRLEHSD